MAEGQPQKKYVFFVYIVESPSAPDLYHGRSEGGRVAEILRLDSIPCVTRVAINQEAFVAALQVGLPEAMKQHPDRHPILHVSAHGNDTGIQLSTGDVVSWAQLRKLLVPINKSLRGALLLCMSACEGWGACRMAMDDGDAPHPYFAMVGSYGKPTWSDTAVSFLTFYHLLSKGRTVRDAVTAMRAASGDDAWLAETAEDLKRGYIEFLKNQVEAATAQRSLESAAAQAGVSPDAKALEAGAPG